MCPSAILPPRQCNKKRPRTGATGHSVTVSSLTARTCTDSHHKQLKAGQEFYALL